MRVFDHAPRTVLRFTAAFTSPARSPRSRRSSIPDSRTLHLGMKRVLAYKFGRTDPCGNGSGWELTHPSIDSELARQVPQRPLFAPYTRFRPVDSCSSRRLGPLR